jgi:AraC-like DNA-binding protein
VVRDWNIGYRPWLHGHEPSVISETTLISRSGWGLPGFKLRKISDFMLSNLGEGFSLTRLAKEAGMSEFHFSRMFKRTTGKSPSNTLSA